MRMVKLYCELCYDINLFPRGWYLFSWLRTHCFRSSHIFFSGDDDDDDDEGAALNKKRTNTKAKAVLDDDDDDE